jgi:hypothetical protein
MAYSPHAGAVEARKSRGTRLRNSSGALSSCALLLVPSPRFSPHRTLLGDAVNTRLHNSTRRRVLPHVRFRVHRRHWRQFSSVWVSPKQDSEFKVVRNREFRVHVSSPLSKSYRISWKSVSVKRRFACNIWSESVTVCESRSVAGKRLLETENHSACATANCNWCKREIVLYSLYLSVITIV